MRKQIFDFQDTLPERISKWIKQNPKHASIIPRVLLFFFFSAFFSGFIYSDYDLFYYIITLFILFFLLFFIKTKHLMILIEKKSRKELEIPLQNYNDQFQRKN